jgi:hypothetical protein
MMLREFYGKRDLIEPANEATIGSRNEHTGSIQVVIT